MTLAKLFQTMVTRKKVLKLLQNFLDCGTCENTTTINQNERMQSMLIRLIGVVF